MREKSFSESVRQPQWGLGQVRSAPTAGPWGLVSAWMGEKSFSESVHQPQWGFGRVCDALTAGPWGRCVHGPSFGEVQGPCGTEPWEALRTERSPEGTQEQPTDT